MERREPLRICIASQSPLLQFTGPRARRHVFGPFNRPSDLRGLTEGTDYRYSPGGVTRMVLPLVRRLLDEEIASEVHWLSLNPTGPPAVHLDGLTLHNLSLPEDRLAQYGATKERIWGTIHGTTARAASAGLFWTEEFAEYGFFNRRMAERIRALDKVHDFDLFYVHDFQLLPLGGMLDTLKPKLLRWHIPFDADAIPSLWRDRLSTYLDGYDAVVVSSSRYRSQLQRFGHTGEIVEMPPYIDPKEYDHPSADEALRRTERFGIPPEDELILVVARMDPMKGQDRAIAAFARIAAVRPNLRLVLVGNGSFSSASGGLGLSKGAQWRAHLERRVEELGLTGRVTFTGHVSQPELDALYERCAFTVLASAQEGFGLVVVESWLHRRATIVSRTAGIADRIVTGQNGLLVEPKSVESLARAMTRLTDRPQERARIASGGRRSVRPMTLDSVVRAESRLFDRLREA